MTWPWALFVSRPDESSEVVDLVLDSGACAMRLLQAHTNMRDLYVCSVSRAYLTYLATSVFCLIDERLGPPFCQTHNLARLNRFIKDFHSTVPALLPCIRTYAQHLPDYAASLSMLGQCAPLLKFKF
ncbi:unnamed protein product [Dibothriocephalus latus]|uniref:Uncharacterized protein n=1 Tax=Dibothriocephalus latus TaxID=60516 RepID=A0A3P7LA33_DIBLA|nr:unnamed protein product [Dibothriocephalus latus]